MMAKRKIEPEDFILLEADEKIKTDIIINNAYDLLPNRKYKIQYHAFNPTYINEQKLMELQSNIVEITY